MKTSLLFISIISLCSCNNANKKVFKANIENDTTILNDVRPDTKIDSLYKWANKKLEVQDMEFSGDTLKFVSTDFYFYYPYGKYTSIDSIQSRYPFMKLNIEIDTTQGDPEKLYRMTYRNSFIKFVKSDETGRIEIIYAKIEDSDVVQLRGIRVGLEKNVFLKGIFNKSVNLKRVNNVKIISGLDGINHNYHFDHDTISSIIMNTDYLYPKL